MKFVVLPALLLSFLNIPLSRAADDPNPDQSGSAIVSHVIQPPMGAKLDSTGQPNGDVVPELLQTFITGDAAEAIAKHIGENNKGTMQCLDQICRNSGKKVKVCHFAIDQDGNFGRAHFRIPDSVCN